VATTSGMRLASKIRSAHLVIGFMTESWSISWNASMPW
jgi:hypothetical protein